MNERTYRPGRSNRTPIPADWPSNHDRTEPLALAPPIFPEDAVAVIDRPSRSVMTSGKARTKGWRLRFERRTEPFIEPLMGYTGGGDTLVQVELRFPTLGAAVDYAERQGLTYRIRSDGSAVAGAARGGTGSHAGIGAHF